MKQNHLPVNLNLNVRGLETSATLRINEISNRLISEGKRVYKFGLGQSPFPVPESVVEALRQNAHQKDYLPVKGLYELRKAVAGFNYRHQGIATDPEDILIGPGSKELIFLLQLVYYGDLLIPTPSWVSYSPQARIIGRHVHWIPASPGNNWRMSPELLDMVCRDDPDRPRVVILNYPSNPTGNTYPVERLKLLAQVARKYKVILISDEIYGMIHHNGQHVSIARYYPEGTIISSGLSKWCGAGGWRLGTFSFPPNLRWLLDAMSSAASETFTSTSAPIQFAAVTAFNGNPEIDEYLRQSRRILKALAKYMTESFEATNIKVPQADGGFYLFPDFSHYREKMKLRGIFTSNEMCNAILKDTGVAMLPGSEFGLAPGELVSRMAYVDFNGAEALNAAAVEWGEKKLNGTFVHACCPHIAEGTDQLIRWLQSL
ncbi:aspartate/methionine/tyrosine aminotransferase [Lentimicrobium saccharophilum]|uniref:Aminotransferase n=1 Tax=Lentimicrobium saccharophilum TaxID=1678841 RepID=A0A0S7BZY6_9BACT|nr:pyridoxal phosphate-dependent aminotransferase [Lentimicrobium saccharophilum]GAP43810.1 aspartate/methionine/tyrosine aminotransferase [Lentimicrobium saccharophilum]